MKVNRNCKIELAASKDETRYSINEPHLDIPEGAGQAMLVATNGRILAAVPVEVDRETEKSGCVSAESLKSARKCAAKGEDALIVANGELAVNRGPTFAREDRGQFPNWRIVVPGDVPEHRRFRLAINPRLLWDLANAIGSPEKVILELDKADSEAAIRVAGNVEGALGVLMPMRMA